MPLPLADLEEQLDAEAHLPAQGARVTDSVEWSPAFAERVTDAAGRSARHVTWTGYGMTDAEGAEWMLSTLTGLVHAHVEERRAHGQLKDQDPVPFSDDMISGIAMRAALEWEKYKVGWIPEPVTDIVHAALNDSAERRQALNIARSIRNQRTATRAGEPGTPLSRIQALTQSKVLSEQIAEAEQLRQLNTENAQRAAEVARQARATAEARVRQEEVRAREDAERRERWLRRPSPAPDQQPFGVSHKGAEALCAAWMRHLGVLDAAVTRFTGDGGIDIDSQLFLAQVKNYAGSVAVADVRALFGVAAADGKKAILFTSGTITVEGQLFADRTGIALLRYDAVAGTIEGLNPVGQQCVESSIVDAMTGERTV